MKKFLTMLAAALATTTAVAAKDMSATDKQITAMEAAVSKAIVDKDTKTLDMYMADEWVGHSESPKPLTKAGLVNGVKSGEIAATSIVNSPLTIRVVGTIAIVQGGDTEKSTYKGKDTSGVYTWTDIVENRGGKWVSIITQVTKTGK